MPNFDGTGPIRRGRAIGGDLVPAKKATSAPRARGRMHQRIQKKNRIPRN